MNDPTIKHNKMLTTIKVKESLVLSFLQNL